MFDTILPPGARSALATLAREQLVPPKTYLAGGTAIALQLGHRLSNDLDFFTTTEFNLDQAIEQLGRFPGFTLRSRADGTIHGDIPGTRISLFHHTRPLIAPAVDYQGMPLASLLDIGAMKLTAVADRGLRRDFVDVAALLGRYSLKELLAAYDQKYQALAVNRIHLLKSLVYFLDAEPEDHPEVLTDGLDWEAVKAAIITAVRALD